MINNVLMKWRLAATVGGKEYTTAEILWALEWQRMNITAASLPEMYAVVPCPFFHYQLYLGHEEFP
jgi:hypothetical protein